MLKILLFDNTPVPALKDWALQMADQIRTLNDHANVLNLREAGWSEDPECLYLVYEYANGGSLLSRLESGLRTPDRSPYCWSLVRQISEALSEAHALDVTHWDISPSKILFREGESVPKLAFIGVNELEYRLSYGRIQRFDGYASPERRGTDRDKLDHSSDYFSLGLVAFHIMAGRPAMSQTLSPQSVDSLPEPNDQEKAILRRLIDPERSIRYRSGFSLISDLSKTSRPDTTVDTYQLVLSDKAVQGIIDSGVARDDGDSLINWVTEQLGSMGSRPVVFSYLSRRSSRIMISGIRVGFRCSLWNGESALTVEDVTFDRDSLERGRGVSLRARFSIFVRQRPPQDTRGTQRVVALHRRLQAHYEGFELRRAREIGLKAWQDILDVQTAILKEEKQGRNLAYDNFRIEGQSARFGIVDSEGEPIENWSPSRTSMIAYRADSDPNDLSSDNVARIGDLTAVTSREVVVSLASGNNVSRIPEEGLLTEDISGEITNIRRQRRAVRAFRSGDIVNDQLVKILLEPEGIAGARPGSRSPVADFHDANLSANENQRTVVERAMAAESLFLIQGPPGTGKTTVIAEIIQQHLSQHPSSNVLITSQTNIAVDNVLDKLGETSLRSDILRLGRAGDDRIGEEWRIDSRMRRWEEGVVERSSEALASLNQRAEFLHAIVFKQQDGTFDALFAQAQDALEEFGYALSSNREFARETRSTAESIDGRSLEIERDADWLKREEEARLGRHSFQRAWIRWWPPRKEQELNDLREFDARQLKLVESRRNLAEMRVELAQWDELL